VSSWGKKRINGTEYDLAHLDPLFIDVTPKRPLAPTYKVRVTFGLHTFAREVLPADPVEHHVRDHFETRCFCPIRYNCSQHLPGIMQNAASGRAHFSQHDNFLLVRNLPGMNGPYAVFFEVRKAKKRADVDAVLFVASAYVKPNLPSNLPTVTMATIVSAAVNGQKIVRPKK
jgi:hypothetical protein